MTPDDPLAYMRGEVAQNDLRQALIQLGANPGSLQRARSLFSSGPSPAERKRLRAESIEQRKKLARNARAKKARRRNRK